MVGSSNTLSCFILQKSGYPYLDWAVFILFYFIIIFLYSVAGGGERGRGAESAFSVNTIVFNKAKTIRLGE